MKNKLTVRKAKKENTRKHDVSGALALHVWFLQCTIDVGAAKKEQAGDSGKMQKPASQKPTHMYFASVKVPRTLGCISPHSAVGTRVNTLVLQNRTLVAGCDGVIGVMLTNKS